MEEQIMIQADLATLARVIDGLVGMPNPDDPGDPDNPLGPWGPWGPVLGPLPDPWLRVQRLGPQPDPWRYGVQVVAANAALSGEQGASREIIGAQLRMLLEDWWCGNEPRWPFPWPKPRGLDLKLRPIDVAVTGAALYQTAAFLEQGDLATEFAKVGATLLERGMTNQ